MLRHPLTPSALALVIVLTLPATSFAYGHLPEPGALLREGTWNGDVGNHEIPKALADIKPNAWPAGGWTRITISVDRIELEPVLAPKNAQPAFMKSIVDQLIHIHGDSPSTADTTQSSAPPVEVPSHLYLRVPGVTLKTGTVPSYKFKNGTSYLSPKLDHRYELMLDKQAFAFTVQNGLRGKNGAAYGDGALYTIEYDGKKFEYSLGEFGWDSRIVAISDLDGDGKPDFVITVGGNNSSYEAVLLSSVAKPGKNPATASLKATGC
jgi:hypothetical protein